MGYVLPVIASLILAAIDAYRIALNKGGPNISKTWTVYYAGIAYCLCIIGMVGYHDDYTPVDALIYLGYYTGIRGVVYAPALNLMRKLPFDYYSHTTNSRLDRFFGSFWKLWFIGLGTSLVFGWLLLITN